MGYPQTIAYPRRWLSSLVKQSGTANLANKSKTADISLDTADSTNLKFNKAGTVVTVLDNSNAVGVLNGTGVTTGGARKTAIQALDGTALHAAVVGWQNPEAVAILVLRVIADITTVATAAATLDIGVTATSATTSSDTLLDGIDVNAAIAVFDSMDPALDSGANAHAQKVAAGKWVTIDEKTGDTTGLVGRLYIDYLLIG